MEAWDLVSEVMEDIYKRHVKFGLLCQIFGLHLPPPKKKKLKKIYFCSFYPDITLRVCCLIFRDDQCYVGFWVHLLI